MNKIAIVTSKLSQGGLTKVIYNLALFINKEEFDLRIFLYGQEDGLSDLEGFVNSGISINSCGIKEGENLYSRINKVKSNLSQFNPDIIHVHTLSATLIAALFLRKYLRVGTLHGNLYFNYSYTYGKVIGYLYAFIHVLSLEFVNHKILVSNFLRRILIKKENYSVILNGIDTSRFQAVSMEEKVDLRKQLGFSETDLIFVSIGRLVKIKNPNFIVRGFLNSNLGDNSHLIFIGTGELEDSIRKEAGEHPRIHILGFQEFPEQYLKIGDYFISSAFSEGLPNAAIEAVNCGLIPLLSDIEAHREIVELAQINHAYFNTHQIDTLIDVFNHLPDATPITLNINLSVQQMVQNHEALFKKLINRK